MKARAEFYHQLAVLLDDYLEVFPEERDALSILLGQVEKSDPMIDSRKNMTGHLTASGVLLNAKRDSALLIYHNFLEIWLQPGGHMDQGEHPTRGAIREFVEETGIAQVKLNRWHKINPIPIDVDTHAIPPNPSKLEGEHYHHDFQYLLEIKAKNKKEAGQILSVLKLDESEVSGYKWVPLNELRDGDYDPRLRRVARKLQELL